jgi:hypothetical protein
VAGQIDPKLLSALVAQLGQGQPQARIIDVTPAPASPYRGGRFAVVYQDWFSQKKTPACARRRSAKFAVREDYRKTIRSGN